jgi:hypothetical protein
MVLEAHDMTKTCKTTLKVGDVLNNKWVILSFIDKGGMGEVYRAHQSNLNRDVAIKVVSQEWLESIDEDEEDVETMVRRFRREVQSMAQIRHPNILQVFDHDSIIVKKGARHEEKIFNDERIGCNRSFGGIRFHWGPKQYGCGGAPPTGRYGKGVDFNGILRLRQDVGFCIRRRPRYDGHDGRTG